LSTRRITIWLWSVTAVIFGLGVFRQVYISALGTETALRTLSLFNLEGEGTLPAWYSSMLMWTVAGLLAAHAVIAHKLGRHTVSYWWALAVIFAFLSLDETAHLHERAELVLPSDFSPGGFFHFRWVIVVGPLVAIVGLAFVPFLLRLPRASALRIMIAGFVFVGGAYGMEHVGAYLFVTTGGQTSVYFAAASTEEGLEMAGLCLFIAALLDLVARETPVLTLRLDGGRRPSG